MNTVSYKEIYLRHKDFLFHHVRKRYTVPEQDQDELVQDAFIKLFRQESLPETDAAMRSFLVITVRNQYIDNYRKRKSHKAYVDEQGVLEPDHDPGDHAVRKLEADLVRDALEQVSKVTGGRELIMKFVDGMSLKEICLATGESMGTVGSKISRAKQKLKEILSQGESRHDAQTI